MGWKKTSKRVSMSMRSSFDCKVQQESAVKRALIDCRGDLHRYVHPDTRSYAFAKLMCTTTTHMELNRPNCREHVSDISQLHTSNDCNVVARTRDVTRRSFRCHGQQSSQQAGLYRHIASLNCLYLSLVSIIIYVFVRTPCRPLAVSSSYNKTIN